MNAKSEKISKSRCLNKFLYRNQGCSAATQAGVTCHYLSRCVAPSAMPRASERLGHQSNHDGFGRARPTFARTGHAIPRCRSRKVSYMETQFPPRRLLGESHEDLRTETERHVVLRSAVRTNTCTKAEICSRVPCGSTASGAHLCYQGTRQSAGICALGTVATLTTTPGFSNLMIVPTDPC